MRANQFCQFCQFCLKTLRIERYFSFPKLIRTSVLGRRHQFCDCIGIESLCYLATLIIKRAKVSEPPPDQNFLHDPE